MQVFYVVFAAWHDFLACGVAGGTLGVRGFGFETRMSHLLGWLGEKDVPDCMRSVELVVMCFGQMWE